MPGFLYLTRTENRCLSYRPYFILRSCLFSAICLLQPVISFAQVNNITLTGTLDVGTGESFPYKLVLTESDGRISGYSITYKEPNDTKANVTGILDRKRGLLNFRETGIVYSGGFHTRAYMCLIDASLGYVQGGKGNVLSGPITSKEADKTLCTGGMITFGNDAEIQNLLSYHDSYDTVITMKKKTKNQILVKEEVKPVLKEKTADQITITKGVNKTYEWHSDSVIIDVWDGGTEDGDRITLLFNNKTYLAGQILMKKKNQLRLQLSTDKINTITLIADNEGTEPPNTASIMLTDGKISYSILAYNKKGDQAVISLKRVH